jgi:predicted esterase
MCQQLIDLESAIRFIRERDGLRANKIFLVGHSLGAYSAAAVMSIADGIAGCACISGMVSGPQMIVERAKEYVGALASFPAPAIEAYQRMLFKGYVSLDAIKGINSTSAPILVCHGADDKVIRIDGQAIPAHRERIKNPSVTYHIGKGLRGGHNSILHSSEAVAYQMEIESELKLLKLKKGCALDCSERKAFFGGINHRLYSAPSEDLKESIIKTFEKA